MGGKVFSSGNSPLHTPRMAPVVYEHVKRQCISALKYLFPRVESPIEAPEKSSFGDIDILVSLEGTGSIARSFADPSAWTPIREALGGVRSYHEVRTGADRSKFIDSMSFAIPWPVDLSNDEGAAQTLLELGQTAATAASDGRVGEAESASKARYVQVDVGLCDNNCELDWRLFKHNHGDLWNMLGLIIRPFGLTADETSLSIRIPEIEKENKKGSRVFLTSNPTEVLDFLGLSHQNGEWERPFKSVKDLFEYAASCKWFMLWPRDTEAEDDKKTAQDNNDNTTATTTATTTSNNNTSNKDQGEEAKKLKHNDRARMKQRAIFARWVDEFIPQCREQRRFLVPGATAQTPDDVRDDVRAQAFRVFPDSGPIYAATLAAWRREKTRIYVKNTVIKGDVCLPADISHVLPAPRGGGTTTAAAADGAPDTERMWRGALRSALAKILIDDDEGFGGVVPPRLRDGQGVLVVEDVKDWINRHWEVVGRVAWEVQCEKVRANVERKRKLAEVTGAADDADDDGKGST
ncbi:hypothetical protein VP1G_07638 [Cytospora mali]|uniref:Uncharacterized protein n=1 Tax=Cytospora mali TaxID=578113 RepID=A0A194V9E7_CYTMA|nr:hypothetical protein VP1G_07638 [Valsa mali var. pyri (nom. inval.)]